MARYISENGEVYNGRYVIQEGVKYLSPSEAKLLALGYRKVEPQEPSEEEVAAMQRAQRIEELKQQLFASDYKALKYAEGWISAEEYAPIKAERQALRDEINELEAEDGE